MSQQDTTVFVHFQHDLAQFTASAQTFLSQFLTELQAASGKLNSVQIGDGLVNSFRSQIEKLRTMVRESAAQLGAEYRTAIQGAVGGPLALPNNQTAGRALEGIGKSAIGSVEQLVGMLNQPGIAQAFPNLAAEGRRALQQISGDLGKFDAQLRTSLGESGAAARGQGGAVTLNQVYGPARADRIETQAQDAFGRTGLADVPTTAAGVQEAVQKLKDNSDRAASASARVADEEEQFAVSLSEATALAKLRVDGWRRVTNAVNAPFAHTNASTGETSYYQVVKQQMDDLFGGTSTQELQKVSDPHVIQQYQAQEGLEASTLKGQQAEKDLQEKTAQLTSARQQYIDMYARASRGESGIGPIGGGYWTDRQNLFKESTTPYGTGLNQLDPISAQYISAQNKIQENLLRRGNPLSEGLLGANQAEPLDFQRLTQSFAGGLFGRGFNPHAQFNIAEALPNVISTAGVLARYGALSTAIYGVTKALADTRREAVDYVDGLTDISVALGTSKTAADAIVPSLEVFSRLAGTNVAGSLDSAARGIRAFGEVGVDNTHKLEGIGVATAQIANQIAVIAHKGLGDATGDVIAIGSAYGIAAQNLSQVSDAIANAKNNLGGDPGQISQGLANFAQVAQQAGIGLQTAANLISVVQAKTDQSGQAVATKLSRIVDVMQGSGAQQVLRGLGVDTTDNLLSQFTQLKAKLDTLGPAATKAIESRLAGTANLREFDVALQESNRIVQASGDSFSKAGAGQQQFDRLNNNLSATLRHLSGDIANIQVNLARSGLLDIFGVAVREAESLLHAVSDLTQGFVTLTHVIPNLGPIPLRSLSIMIAEVFLGYKAWQTASGALTRAQVQLGDVTQTLNQIVENLAGTTDNETAMEAANAETKDLVTAATVAEADSRKAATDAINEETTALVRQNDARLAGLGLTRGQGAEQLGQATSPGNTATEEGALAGGLGATKTRITEFLSGALGKIFIGLAALQIGDSVYNGVKGYVDRGTAADATSRGAYKDFSQATTAAELSTAARELKAAAQQQAHASTGIVGTLGNLIEGNPHTHTAQDDATAATLAEKFAKILTDQQQKAAGSGSAGAFTDLTSPDGVKAGLDALTASGTGAATAFHALTQALDGAMRAATEGGAVIVPGGAPAFGVRAATSASAAIRSAIEDTVVGGRLEGQFVTMSGDAPRQNYNTPTEFKGYADYLTNKWFDTKTTAGFEDKTQSTVEGYLKQAGVSTGGALTPTQLNDLIDNQILPIWKNQLVKNIDPKYIPEVLKNFHDKLASLITGNGDFGSLIQDQDTSAFVQQTLVAQAQQKYQDSQYGDAHKLAGILSNPVNLVLGPFGFNNAKSQVRQAETGTDAVARAQQQVADINKAMGEAVAHGTKITDQTAQAWLQAQATLQQALEARAESIAKYHESLLSSDDAVGRDQANLAELNRQAAFYAQRGPNYDPNKARDLRTQANDVRQQTAKDLAAQRAAAITDFVNPGDALATAQAQVQGDTVLLNATAKYDKNGKITKAWADAYAKVAQDRHGLTQAQLDLTDSEVAANARPGSDIAAASVKLQQASNELNAAIPGTADYWQKYAALQQAKYDAANAELTGAHEARLGQIDITNPVAIANENYKQAKAKYEKDLKDHTGDLQADKNDVTSTYWAKQKSLFDQRLQDIQSAQQIGTISEAAYVGWLEQQDRTLRRQMEGMRKGSAGYRQLTEELQSIDQNIKQASDQFAGQWNIGDIKVPTPYEVLRYIKANGHYQDTTQKSVDSSAMSMPSVTNHTTNHVSITVNGGNPREVQRELEKYFGASTLSRAGTTTQRVHR